MSWKTIHMLLGLAATDKSFENELLENPVEATKNLGYDLTDEEIEALCQSKADTLAEFSKNLLVHLPLN